MSVGTAKDLVFVGPPGAGKGTQAALLSSQRGLAHISTGDLFRQNLKNKTPVGILAQGYMDKGLLVPDEVVCDMVRGRLAERDTAGGFILDGFPRTRAQGEALDAMLQKVGRTLTAVVLFEVRHEILLERLTGRLTCRSCGAIFHRTLNPPKVSGTCDSCGSHDLYTREDDRAEKVEARLQEYREKTEPLVTYYEGQRRKLIRVDGLLPIEQVRTTLERVIFSS